MCELGKCVLELIPNAPKCECGCFFNGRQDKAIEELETTEIKTEGPMFDGILRDKRKP